MLSYPYHSVSTLNLSTNNDIHHRTPRGKPFYAEFLTKTADFSGGRHSTCHSNRKLQRGAKRQLKFSNLEGLGCWMFVDGNDINKLDRQKTCFGSSRKPQEFRCFVACHTCVSEDSGHQVIKSPFKSQKKDFAQVPV